MTTEHPAAIAERFERLAIELIVPSKTNPRTHFDETYITNLAASIVDKGVLEPILVRPLDVMQAVMNHPDAAARNGATFEIVAGECRYRASKVAKATHLPAMIREYSNEQVLEIQLIENLHRHDLQPMEQARGFRALIDSNPTKHSAESIATRIGMSPAWVWDRMKLLDLIPAAQTILEQDRISVGHAILIARLKPADQTRAISPEKVNRFGGSRDGLWQNESGFLELDEAEERRLEKADPYHGLKPVSVRELEGWIRNHIRFDVEHAAKAQPLVFEQTAAKVDEAAAQPGRGKKVVSITHEYRVADDARDDKERTYGSQSWQRADGQFKSKTCEHSVLGVVVAGHGQGDTFDVCVARDKCRVHFGNVIQQKEKNAKLRESGKAPQAAKREAAAAARAERAELERQRKQERWSVLSKAIENACDAAAAKLKKVSPALLAASLVALRLPKATVAGLPKMLVHEAMSELSFHWEGNAKTVAAFAKLLGVDVKALEPKAEATQTSGVKAKKSAKGKKDAA